MLPPLVEHLLCGRCQRTYELIRPIVLFGQPPGERAAETSTATRTIYRQVARFDTAGVTGRQAPLLSLDEVG